jgi:hypothetical protein
MAMTFIEKTKKVSLVNLVIVSVLLLSLTGCQDMVEVTSKDIVFSRQAFGWKAENFFTDPELIECCEAIVNGDKAKLNRLLDSGVDLNVVGKDGMTLLLWSMPVPVRDETDFFELLLKRGANPNIKFTGDLGTKQRIRPKDTVASIAAKSRVKTLRIVLAHGADLSQLDSWGNTLLHTAIQNGGGQIKDRVQLLIDCSSDLDRYNSSGETPAQYAVKRSFYGVALMLLKAGAKHDLYEQKSCQRLIHFVVSRSERLSESQWPDCRALMEYLIEQGEDVQEVREDLNRWAKVTVPSTVNWEQERQMMMARSERKAKERTTKAKDVEANR